MLEKYGKMIVGNVIKVSVAAACLWLSLCVIYITVCSGWNNIFSLLPSEFFIVLLAIVFPIALLAIVAMIANIATNVGVVKSEIAAIAKRDSGGGEAMAMLAQLFREHREVVAAQMKAQVEGTAQLVQVTRDSRDGIVDELRSQRALSHEITQELSLIAQNRAIATVKDTVAEPSQRIDRMHALAEVLGFALNDLSMTATQLLTEILDAVHGDKEGTRKFIATVTSAYFAGDKNVFFRSLAREVANDSDRLRELAGDAEVVRQQISKILREAKEIKSLVTACDPNDLVRIVFEDGELWAMEKALAEHFNTDGTPI